MTSDIKLLHGENEKDLTPLVYEENTRATISLTSLKGQERADKR